jgi:hypothetical protein
MTPIIDRINYLYNGKELTVESLAEQLTNEGYPIKKEILSDVIQGRFRVDLNLAIAWANAWEMSLDETTKIINNIRKIHKTYHKKRPQFPPLNTKKNPSRLKK